MKKIILLSAVVTLVFASVHLAAAQQPKKVPRIGYVGAGSPATAGHHAQAFVRGLRELGYVEGRNFMINLKTAKQIGLSIPQAVLYRADRVIK